jgi:hypothetical protein
MHNETIGYSPRITSEMPEIRQKKDILFNLAPGKLPTELDHFLSSAVISRMSK